MRKNLTIGAKCAVVTTYSFAPDEACIVLVPDEDAAVAYLRATYEEERNGDLVNGHVFESEIAEDGHYAKIINYRRSGDIDTTEWCISSNVSAI